MSNTSKFVGIHPFRTLTETQAKTTHSAKISFGNVVKLARRCRWSKSL